MGFMRRKLLLTIVGSITVNYCLAYDTGEDFVGPPLNTGQPESHMQLAFNMQDDSNPGLQASGETKPDSEEAAVEGYTPEQIAEMINNPLGELWMLFTQNDTYSYGGNVLDMLDKSNRIMNSTLLMPVMPFQFTDDWRLVLRPVIPLNSFSVPQDVSLIPGISPEIPPEINVDFGRETGLGDIVVMASFGSNQMVKPPNIFGFGLTMMFDTASKDELGTGKNSIGPMAMAMHIDDKWMYGVIAQHWESFSGSDNRNDVSLTDIQYIGRYRLTPETNIGFSPNIRYNWEADSGDRWSIPVGLGMDTMISLGPVPAKIGVEAHYYVKQPDAFGPEWQIRFFLSPVLPAPKWTKKPRF